MEKLLAAVIHLESAVALLLTDYPMDKARKTKARANLVACSHALSQVSSELNADRKDANDRNQHALALAPSEETIDLEEGDQPSGAVKAIIAHTNLHDPEAV